MIAKTFHGLENVLAEELTKLGGNVTAIHNRAVSFEGSKNLLYKVNLHTRTALRILIPIHQFEVFNEHDLYRKIQQIDWRNYFSQHDTFAIDSVVNSKQFTHSKYVALKVKDAIVDQFRQHTGSRPSVDTIQPTVRLHVHLFKTHCSISLDSSGDSLHKRGYRLSKTKAPLNEVLAAGMILLSGWKADRHFIDPMCGSGTLVIEAAMLAHRIAPNIYRKNFGFQNWKNFDSELWANIQAEAKAQQLEEIDIQIIGSDISRRAITAARENVGRAEGVDESIRLSCKDFSERQPPKGEGVLMMNPPYGERLQVSELNEFYRNIGDTLKQHYAGYKAWIISSDKAAMKNIGLRTFKKMTLYNGSLECKFHGYDLYKGSRKP